MEPRGLKRGDIVRVAEGKPRPAIVVQSDTMPTPTDVLLCPLTTMLLDAPLYRVSIAPSESNGLLQQSQAIVDKVGPARRDRLDGVIGHLDGEDMARIDAALAVMLDLGM